MKQQKRRRSIAMTPEELDTFLAQAWTCRLATVGTNGQPHVSPVWFLWHEGAIWISSVTRSQRWRDIERNPRVSLTVDEGQAYGELRGVTIEGRAAAVGDVPRVGAEVPELEAPERLTNQKYRAGEEFEPDGYHAWLKVTPDKISSWDFRKLPPS
ncbi:pyridoxamine 5'-phosphate oxidase family protein [Granulicoccus phenolivorans]|uniref:pyridoxamine 5'-phosphate oxidase family protein n=1 Tax=Granulicoccus phenolivorans TaxID=266854 RepID=UPI0003F8DAB3|nr:pyridoxamine 5'-phosphate oxidase family protein [Granulicoccus phenolivorans]